MNIRAAVCACAVWLVGLCASPGDVLAADEIAAQPVVSQQLVLVTGAAGADEFVEPFKSWSDRWREAAGRGGVECISIGPAEQVEGTAPATSDRDRLLAELARVVPVATSEPLWIVFIGHGTFDGRTARLNLSGPDVSAEELAQALQPASRPVAAIFCASSTSPFINSLSGQGRAVISATKDGNQVQFSRFGDALSAGISSLEADIDRDGQSSLLEAWLYASRRTAEFYKSEGRLATEHSLLDDNGDAKGSRAELFDGIKPAANIEAPDQVDGAIAKHLVFLRSAEEQAFTPDERILRDALEARIDVLKQRRDSIDEDSYFQQLEELLLPLSRLYDTVELRRAGSRSEN